MKRSEKDHQKGDQQRKPQNTLKKKKNTNKKWDLRALENYGFQDSKHQTQDINVKHTLINFSFAIIYSFSCLKNLFISTVFNTKSCSPQI